MRRIKGRWVLLALLIAAGGYALWRAYVPGASREGAFGAGAARVSRIVPDSLRIKVEVLNATNIRGLARRGSFVLRDLGFDVVYTGNSAEQVDSTTVYVRSGRMDWGELAAQGLGGARVIARPDSSRYLDLTILLGASWRPPAEAFHP
jgi:hypothetical protein